MVLTLRNIRPSHVVPWARLRLLPQSQTTARPWHDVPTREASYDEAMLRPIAEYVAGRVRRRMELIAFGYSWSFVVMCDAALVLITIVSVLQRRGPDLPAALCATVIAIGPFVALFVSGIKFTPWFVWLASSAATAVFLFATTKPVEADFAPLLLVLMVGMVGAITSAVGGLVVGASSAALLLIAAAEHRIHGVGLYLSVVALGWLVGYLLKSQQRLLIEAHEMQSQLAEQTAADERRRIAREVHDVIAHSLTVTLLHVTGARRGLQQDRDIDDAVEGLMQAERLGRQAMADIRRTVGLLDDGRVKTTPEPGIADIPTLVDDFVHAGLAVALRMQGSHDRVTSAVGLALYRITQESLANIAKHTPEEKATVDVVVSHSSALVSIVNELPVGVIPAASYDGRGLRGMRQRVDLLGGEIEIGPVRDGWSVRAEIPLTSGAAAPRPCAW
jgi:signal transduction histidine kinase